MQLLCCNKETPIEVCQEGGREEESIRLGPGLAQEWMLTKAEGVIVGVIRSIGIGHTQLTGEQRRPFSVRLRSFAGVVADRPVPFMEEAFIVAPGAHRLTREIEDLGSEA